MCTKNGDYYGDDASWWQIAIGLIVGVPMVLLCIIIIKILDLKEWLCRKR